jgi:hypothetical protein
MHCPVCACTSALSTSPMASSRAAVCWKAMPITSTSTSLGVVPMAASWACSPYNRSNAVSFLLGFFHHQLRSSLLLPTSSMGAGRRSMSPEVAGCCLCALASMRAKKLGSSPVSDVLIGLTARPRCRGSQVRRRAALVQKTRRSPPRRHHPACRARKIFPALFHPSPIFRFPAAVWETKLLHYLQGSFTIILILFS